MALSVLKKITVKCSKGEVLEVDEGLVNASQTLKSLIEERGNKGENMITLSNISRETLSQINEFVKKHENANAKLASSKAPYEDHKKSLNLWDEEFKNVDIDTLFNLIVAIHYLKIESLLSLGCETMADIIKDKSVEEVRRIFNIKNDFTPEEEEENRRMFPKAHEP